MENYITMKAPKINKYAGGGSPQSDPKLRKEFPKGYDPNTGIHTAGVPASEDSRKLSVKEWNDINLGMGRKLDPRYLNDPKVTYPKYIEKETNVEQTPQGWVSTDPRGDSFAKSYGYEYKENIGVPKPSAAPTSTRTFVSNDANGNTVYRDNATGETFMLDRAGNPITPLGKANGGYIKAPFFKKKVVNGYTNGGDVTLTPDEQNNGYYIKDGIKYNSQGIAQTLQDNSSANNTNSAVQGGASALSQSGGQAGNIGKGMGWIGAATALKGFGQSQLKSRDETGYLKDKNERAANEIMTPDHEHMMKDINDKNYLALGLDSMGVGKFARAASAMTGNDQKDTAFNRAIGANTDYLKSRKIQENQKSEAAFAGNVSDRNSRINAAEGGTIKGPGTAKSDSILSKIDRKGIPSGSFIVPAENNGLAKKLREKYLGGNPDKIAKFKKAGEVEADVAVSNKEHLFTPPEKKKIISKIGEEVLEELAPNAEENDMEDMDEMKGMSEEDMKKHHEEMMKMDMEHKANGGELTATKARTMLHDKSANGKPLTDKQRRFFGWVAGGRKSYGGMVNKAEGGALTYKERENLPTSDFVFEKERKYPIHDENHARNALARVSQFGSSSEKAAVKSAVKAKYPNIDIEKACGGTVKLANGGEVPEGAKLGQYYYKKGNWIDASGNKLTKEFGQKYTDAYFKQTGGKSKDQLEMEADVRVANEKNNPGYNNPTKTGAQLESLQETKPSSLGRKLSAPKTGVTSAKQAKLMSEMGTVNPIQTPTSALSNQIQTQEATLKTPTYNNQTETPTAATKEGIKWSGLGSKLGSGLEYGASAAQIGLGLRGLTKAGKMPVGKIDPLFQASVDKAQAAARFGFTPEQQFSIDQDRQNALNAARFAARNYSGGNAGTAFNQERAAINENWGLGLKSKIAGQQLMQDKQRYADELALQKAGMSRQLFEDKMAGWNQQQQAGSQLLGAGIRNLISAGRYSNELDAQKQRQQYNG